MVNSNTNLWSYCQRLTLNHPKCQKTAFFSLTHASLPQLQIEKSNFLHSKEMEYYNTLCFPKRQYSYLLGRYCVKEALKQMCPDIDSKKILLENGVFGQPFIESPSNSLKTHITLSHTNAIAVAIAFPEEYPMGIDIEYINPQIEQILLEQLTDKEKESIALNAAPSRATYYTLYWTLKEALSKTLRTGMTVPFILYAVKNLCCYYNYWVADFEHFTQYQAVSFLVADHYVCSIVYPKKSTLALDLTTIYQVLQANLF